MSTAAATDKRRQVASERLSEAVIRFAGDSGDGMQLTGNQFTGTSALVGNDLSTLPDFPAEIRAPAGTLPGVSAFQVRIADYDIHTPGDAPDVLVAMNPAALKAHLKELKSDGVVIINTDEFTKRNFGRAGLEADPLEDGTLEGYRAYPVALTRLTREALAESTLDTKSKDRCKNLFALGMCYWLFSRPLGATEEWIQQKFKKAPDLVSANIAALRAGYNYCDVTEVFQVRYEVEAARLAPGLYRNIQGNVALALGLVAASRRSGLPLFLGSYPITPASDILHLLSSYKNFGVTTFQAEDEIGAVCAAVGASFGGALAVTSTSGPGMALKSEGINLAVMAELPLVICDIQRAGPSTGMPTKTEQSDLLQALYGRNGESPVPVVAASSPGDCFYAALEACRIAVQHMVPVILLSDGYLANGSEPWVVPRSEDLPEFLVTYREVSEGFLPYDRDPETLARPWAVPGTPGLEHRIGGLESQEGTGNVSYDGENHEKMVALRQEKVDRVAREIPDLEVHGGDGDLLVLGWGSSQGAIIGGVERAQAEGRQVSRAHLRYLNPFPGNTREVLERFPRVLVPEMNSGQLALLLQGKFLKPVVSYPKVQGRPFTRRDIHQKIVEVLEADPS
jgi:2-oxoglutarate ferredoxin oxidoreductase subunit alpha